MVGYVMCVGTCCFDAHSDDRTHLIMSCYL